MNQILKGIYDAILEGERENTKKQVQAALEQGVEARTILDKMIEAMGEVGRLFEEGEYFVPEMLISARSMQEGLGVLKPHLAEADVKAVGKVVAGTVKGDLHDIGKNLVVMMLEGGGFEVVDLGCDVSPEQFVQAVKETGAQIVAMSALLTTTMPNMKVTIDALKEAGLRDKVKVMVGGAPLNAQYAEQIGADGYSPDAPGAVRLAKSLL
ncbi:MAG TPA: cobalamin-binding protein [Chloroflexi bacterium]|jgi:5-methyltetrahydrofolate--homocysteine methyltransferase|nr:cobalamin-binding protein [Chloroflexota bacterium]